MRVRGASSWRGGTRLFPFYFIFSSSLFFFCQYHHSHNCQKFIVTYYVTDAGRSSWIPWRRSRTFSNRLPRLQYAHLFSLRVRDRISFSPPPPPPWRLLTVVVPSTLSCARAGCCRRWAGADGFLSGRRLCHTVCCKHISTCRPQRLLSGITTFNCQQVPRNLYIESHFLEKKGWCRRGLDHPERTAQGLLHGHRGLAP
jgi:hypothetical protein